MELSVLLVQVIVLVVKMKQNVFSVLQILLSIYIIVFAFLLVQMVITQNKGNVNNVIQPVRLVLL
jgi:TRAP-type C4-dicarboxylate transport system permease small subunit